MCGNASTGPYKATEKNSELFKNFTVENEWLQVGEVGNTWDFTKGFLMSAHKETLSKVSSVANFANLQPLVLHRKIFK